MSDLISIELALKTLCDLCKKPEEVKELCPYRFAGCFYGVLCELPTVNAEPEQRWIPVTERLPKAGEHIGNVEKYYLVQNEYGDMLVARYTHSEYWEQIYQLKPIGDEIVAWMPLPEPYKMDESQSLFDKCVEDVGDWMKKFNDKMDE